MPSDILIKQQIIDTVRMFCTHGLGVGTAGNLSVRSANGFIITPTGLAYEQLKPDLLVELDAEGNTVTGHLRPSSEWRFHRDIYRSDDEAGAIVHVHSPYATAMACTHQSIPAFHYMVAIAGGDSIRCADYATFGTAELSNYVIRALQDRKACLLANHGMIALGRDVSSAFRMAQEVEELAKQYCYSLQIGSPVVLDNKEMQTVLEKFKHYGRQGEEDN